MISDDGDGGSILMVLPSDPFKAICTVEERLVEAVAWADCLLGDDSAELFNSLSDANDRAKLVKRKLQRRRKKS